MGCTGPLRFAPDHNLLATCFDSRVAWFDALWFPSRCPECLLEVQHVAALECRHCHCPAMVLWFGPGTASPLNVSCWFSLEVAQGRHCGHELNEQLRLHARHSSSTAVILWYKAACTDRQSHTLCIACSEHPDMRLSSRWASSMSPRRRQSNCTVHAAATCTTPSAPVAANVSIPQCPAVTANAAQVIQSESSASVS